MKNKIISQNDVIFLKEKLKKHFPQLKMSFKVNTKRDHLVITLKTDIPFMPDSSKIIGYKALSYKEPYTKAHIHLNQYKLENSSYLLDSPNIKELAMNFYNVFKNIPLEARTKAFDLQEGVFYIDNFFCDIYIETV